MRPSRLEVTGMVGRVARTMGAAAAGVALIVGPGLSASADVEAPSDAGSAVGTVTFTPPIPAVGGTGRFTFNASSCTFTSTPDEPPEIGAETGSCFPTTATGTYANTACG